MNLYRITIILTLFSSSILAQQYQAYNIDQEIESVVREINKLQSDRQRNAADIDADSKEYSDYNERMKFSFKRIEGDADSLKKEIEKETQIRDSLSAVYQSITTKKKNIEIANGKILDQVVVSCDSILAVVKSFPPLGTDKFVSALEFLKGELQSKKIGTEEGIDRLVQMCRDLEEISMNTQTAQTVSPVPDIVTSTFRIRIGAWYEAVVDEKEQICAVWQNYNEKSSHQWRIIHDPALAGQIARAIRIREGKALPDFVQLPIR